jgi:FixJ family two-component response regulator
MVSVAYRQARRQSGLELQEQLLAEGHHTPVIFVTVFPEEKFKNRAMNAGSQAAGADARCPGLPGQ